MKIGDKEIQDILLKENYVSAEDLKKAEDYAAANHASITDFLIREGLVTKELLGQALAESYNVPYADFASYQLPQDQAALFPEAIAKKYRAALFKVDEKQVTVATDDPRQTALIAKVKKIFKDKEVALAFSLPEDIEETYVRYHKALETKFSKIIKSQNRVAPEIIEAIVDDAVLYHASDIHFEPQEKEVLVRFRIDGVLHEAGKIPKEYYENVLNRMKVQAHLRIDEHSAAQDGAIRLTRGELAIDLRLSIIPTLDGEKAVMRLLAEYVRSFTLADLGLAPQDEKKIEEAIKKPFGMILVAGPTGSGKTTTLYALLKILNRSEVNITTIEDPVEYRVVGVNQIQVNNETNLSFAQGLRSIVRQDPNIILVGEIRDKETAEISVNAALTGHLLLSTFHANDAATTIPRLMDMGTEPFLLTSTLEIIIAQRLVRKICEGCRHSVAALVKDLEKKFVGASLFFADERVTLFEGKGCTACNFTGYKGRVGIFEIIQVTKELQEAILNNPASSKIWELAKKQGARVMFEDGIDKVKNGVTTLDEVLRVARPG